MGLKILRNCTIFKKTELTMWSTVRNRTGSCKQFLSRVSRKYTLVVSSLILCSQMLQFAIHTGIACSTTTEIQNSICGLCNRYSFWPKFRRFYKFISFFRILAYCVEGCQKRATWARFWILVSTTDSLRTTTLPTW